MFGGIKIEDAFLAGQRQIAVWGMYENIWIHHLEAGLGLYIGGGGTTTQYFNRCSFKDGGHRIQIGANAGGIAFNNCIFEHGLTSDQPYVDLQGALNVKFDQCWFEGKPNSATPGPPSEFVRVGANCRVIALTDCLFSQRVGAASENNSVRAIRVIGPARGVCITNPFFFAPGDASLGDKSEVVVDAVTAGPQNEVVIIGGDLSDNTGILRRPHMRTSSPKTTHLGTAWRVTLPRLSNADLVDLPIDDLVGGELVFNTDAGKVQVRSGGAWVDV